MKPFGITRKSWKESCAKNASGNFLLIAVKDNYSDGIVFEAFSYMPAISIELETTAFVTTVDWYKNEIVDEHFYKLFCGKLKDKKLNFT